MSKSDIPAVRNDIVEAFGNATDLFGLRSNLGRVYGALYFSDGPISFPKIVERSNCTRASAANALEALERMQLVDIDMTTGQEEYIVVERAKDIDRVVVDDFLPLMKKEAKDVLIPLYEAEEYIEAAESSKMKQRYQTRLEELINYFETQQMLMEQFEEMSEVELKRVTNMVGLSLE